MRWRGVRSAEPNSAQKQGERDDDDRDERQGVENVNIGQMGRLRLHLPANPDDSPPPRLRRRSVQSQKKLCGAS